MRNAWGHGIRKKERKKVENKKENVQTSWCILHFLVQKLWCIFSVFHLENIHTWENTCQLLSTVSAGEFSKLLVNPRSWSSVSGNTAVEINVIVQLTKHNVPES